MYFQGAIAFGIAACEADTVGKPVNGVSGAVSTAGTSSSASEARETALSVLQRVNVARATSRRCGNQVMPAAPALRLDHTLIRVAESHAADMVDKGYFSHRSAEGTSPAARVRAAGYAHSVGENLAWTEDGGQDPVDVWLASPAHCEVLMQGKYDEAGIGVRQRPHGRTYWVLLLGDSSAMPAAHPSRFETERRD